MKRNLICIICPRGCSLCVEGEGAALTVVGNACPKGEQYAIDECTHPTRTVTSIVRVSNREDTMVSVKTAAPIPKENIFDVMKLIRAAKVEAPVRSGTVILSNVFGTDVIATKTIR
ncbi:MAG: DUF1667 domain-containing protein [Ruminococcaceae bacterium]|nr:DUF1667 domain-containing protein [Oscillospiraceae bacterium]